MASLELIFCSSNKLFGKLIEWRTYGEWAHVAIRPKYSMAKIVEASVLHGFHETDIGTLKRKNKRVEGIVLDWHPTTTDAQVNQLIGAMIGAPYDWSFIFGAMFRVNQWNNEKSWACSEAGAYVSEQLMSKQLFPTNEKIITPEMLYNAVWPIKSSRVVYK